MAEYSKAYLVRNLEVRAHFRHDLELLLKLVRRVELPEVFLLDRKPQASQGCERFGNGTGSGT